MSDLIPVMHDEQELDRILDLLLTDPDGEGKSAVAGLSTEGQQALLNRAMQRSVEANRPSRLDKKPRRDSSQTEIDSL